MFSQYFLLLLLLQIVAFYCRPSINSPLLGEKVRRARNNEFPFVVSLSRFKCRQRTKNHLCGGALISNRHILTSAHCLVKEYPENLVAIVGNVNAELGRVYKVKSWITYDDWAKEMNVTPLYNDNDIAIVKLRERVRDIKPGIISKLTYDKVIGRNVVTAGWGYINGTTNLKPKTLQKVNLKVLSLQEYEKIVKEQTVKVEPAPNNYYTIAYPTAVLGCGDSGGPLLLSQTYEIVGVNDSTCNIDEPNEKDHAASFHMVVDYYRDFIMNVTKK